METIHITKKINENEYKFDKLIKKSKHFLDENYYGVFRYPIKLVFEEGITEVNEKIIKGSLLRYSVVEIVYPNTLTKLPSIYFNHLQKITIPNNLKEISCGNLDTNSLSDINLHNNIKIIGSSTFVGQRKLNTICIYPSVKKIEKHAFYSSKIKRLIFFSTNAELDQFAFLRTEIDKLYCTNPNLLTVLVSSKAEVEVNELTIIPNLIPTLANLVSSEKGNVFFRKLIIDTPYDFYYLMQYYDDLRMLKSFGEVILSHDYVVENFEEVKDVYEEPNLDNNNREFNDKCNIILNSCFNEKLKEEVLNYLICIVKKNNETILNGENYSYNDFNNFCLSTKSRYYSANSNYYSNNTFVNKLDDILTKINFLNHNILINNEILSLLDDIEELMSEVNITDEELSYLDGSLYSDIYKYLYVLELVDFDLRQKYRAKLLKIISKYKTLIYENIDNNKNDFLNINVLYKDTDKFEHEFRTCFFKQLSSFYKEYFESKGTNASDVANGIASIYDNAKDRRRNIYYKVITELIEEIKMLNYGKDKSIIEKLDNIISVNLNELDECKLYNIIKELSEIKYFLQYKENKLKEKGWLNLAKKKTK